jgi:16S rRNA (uracil1498-N3)-methyltransferase
VARLYVPGERLDGAAADGRLEIGGEAHRYLSRVLRLGAGDEVTLFDGRGVEVEARIVASGARATRLELGARRAVAAAAGARVTLLQAIAKGERMDWLVEKATELGVARIAPVVTARGVARPDGEAGRVRRWRTLAAEAARQCGRADVPAVDAPRALAAALAAPDLELGPLRLVLWENAPPPPPASAPPPRPRSRSRSSSGPRGA